MKFLLGLWLVIAGLDSIVPAQAQTGQESPPATQNQREVDQESLFQTLIWFTVAAVLILLGLVASWKLRRYLQDADIL